MEESKKNIQLKIQNNKFYLYLNENLNKNDSLNNVTNKDTFRQISNKKTAEQQTALFTNDSHDPSFSDPSISYFQKIDFENTNKGILESNKEFEEVNNRINEDTDKKNKIENLNIENKNNLSYMNGNKNIFMYKNYNIGNILKIKNELNSLSKYKENCYNKIYNENQKKLKLTDNNINNNLLKTMKCRSYSLNSINTINKKKNCINSKIIKKNYIFGFSVPRKNNYSYQNSFYTDKTKPFYTNSTNNKNEYVGNCLKNYNYETALIKKDYINVVNRVFTPCYVNLFRSKNEKNYCYDNTKDYSNVKYIGLLKNNYPSKNNDKYKNINKFLKNKD